MRSAIPLAPSLASALGWVQANPKPVTLPQVRYLESPLTAIELDPNLKETTNDYSRPTHRNPRQAR